MPSPSPNYPLLQRMKHGMQFGWAAVKAGFTSSLLLGGLILIMSLIPFLHWGLLTIPVSMAFNSAFHFLTGFYDGFKRKPND